ncbi:hypothetical protein Y032_0003g1588 [Ancylostoma ceylanicum]|uniref:Uncharacterized protein n=1 Tax=Ancylostoma ceylanicum TaxID=53326 RepID=A0A016VYQ6_9BILA|nr:hypothetical protein Y032_0003g1588 [Ancylostoma ceylanicum]
MININEAHPMRLPAYIIDRRSDGRQPERRQQGAASRTTWCGYRTRRNIQTVFVLSAEPVQTGGRNERPKCAN